MQDSFMEMLIIMRVKTQMNSQFVQNYSKAF